MKKEVGSVTPEERDRILELFERKNGLSELLGIVDPANEALYEKLVKDMGHTTTLFKKWWDEKAVKYSWQSREGGHWEIDFDTCRIYLV